MLIVLILPLLQCIGSAKLIDFCLKLYVQPQGRHLITKNQISIFPRKASSCSRTCTCWPVCHPAPVAGRHYLNSRVMLYQTVGIGSHKIPLKQLRIRGPARLNEAEIATDAECWERRCGFRGRRQHGGKGTGPFSLPWDQDIPFPGMLLCEERRGKKITYANNAALTGQWMGKEAAGWGFPLKSRRSVKHTRDSLCAKKQTGARCRIIFLLTFPAGPVPTAPSAKCRNPGKRARQ